MDYLVEENYVTICHYEDYGPGCLGFQTNEQNLLVQSIILNHGGMMLALQHTEATDPPMQLLLQYQADRGSQKQEYHIWMIK